MRKAIRKTITYSNDLTSLFFEQEVFGVWVVVFLLFKLANKFLFKSIF